MITRRLLLSFLTSIAFVCIARSAEGAGTTSVTDYGSVQEAIDRNPGRMVFVPPGDYLITSALHIRTNNSGLWGFGRIIQADPDAPILAIDGAANVQIRNVTLTRADGKLDSTREGIGAKGSENLVLDGVRVINNRSQRPAILVVACNRCQIRNCSVENYMRIGVDDRTRSSDWGFAFNVIDGTGMDIRDCVGALIANNRILEHVFRPTPQIKQKYNLGAFIKMNPQKGTIVPQAMWDAKYYNAWHQGAALHVAGPETGDYIQILGNYIESAAQGLDIQADHVIVAQNIVNDAFIGMKAMHGARNVVIVGNQFSRDDLWSIGLMPGAASHAAGDPRARTSRANVDGYHIVAHNIISDFGYGSAYWMWHGDRMKAYAIRLDQGQKPENPPLRDVIIDGNVIYNTGKDGVLVDGKPVVQPPRYKYDVFIAPGPLGPQGIRFADNIFDPGTDGVANVPLAR